MKLPEIEWKDNVWNVDIVEMVYQFMDSKAIMEKSLLRFDESSNLKEYKTPCRTLCAAHKTIYFYNYCKTTALE